MTLRVGFKQQDEFGNWIFQVSPESLEKVRQGYACNRCLEEFVENGLPTRLDRCPVCGEPTVIDRYGIVPTPAEWTAYVQEREAAYEGGRG